MNSDRSMSSPSPTPMQSTMRGQHVWQPDASAKRCTVCDHTFNLIRRRHHCRRCGNVICNDCSMHRLRIPVTRIAVNSKSNSHPERPSTANSIASSDGDDMDVVRVCDTCYSKHQQLKSKRKARAASIESNNTMLTQLSRQSSRQSSRHSSPSSARSSIHITNEHNQPITHQLLRPSSSNQLTSTVTNNQLHAQSRSPHAPAQASVLPSVPSLPRTPRQIDQSLNQSKNHEHRMRSQSSSDTITTTVSPLSTIKRSMSSASQASADVDDRQPVDASTIVRSQSGSPSSTRHLEIVTTANSSSTSQTAVSRRSPKLRSSNNQSIIHSNSRLSSSDMSNDVVAADFMSPKAVHHRSEFVAPAWCDNVLAATGISLPLTNQTAVNQSVNQSLQTEAFMDSLYFLGWIHPILKLFRSFAAAFSDRPVACMIVVPLILIILHRLRPFYQTILVIVQLFTLHNAIWRLLSTNESAENRTIKQTVTAVVHTFLHDTTTPFVSSQSDKKLTTITNNRATDLAWLCFGLFACYLSYFVHWPVFWSACLVKDFTRVVAKKHKTN